MFLLPFFQSLQRDGNIDSNDPAQTPPDPVSNMNEASFTISSKRESEKKSNQLKDARNGWFEELEYQEDISEKQTVPSNDDVLYWTVLNQKIICIHNTAAVIYKIKCPTPFFN